MVYERHVTGDEGNTNEDVFCGVACEWLFDVTIVVTGTSVDNEAVFGETVDSAVTKDFKECGEAIVVLPTGDDGVVGIDILESVRFCGDEGVLMLLPSLHCCSSVTENKLYI